MEWTLVCPSKRRAQLAFNAMRFPPVKSSLRSSTAKGKTLRFAMLIDYKACKGYVSRIDPAIVMRERVFEQLLIQGRGG